MNVKNAYADGLGDVTEVHENNQLIGYVWEGVTPMWVVHLAGGANCHCAVNTLQQALNWLKSQEDLRKDCRNETAAFTLRLAFIEGFKNKHEPKLPCDPIWRQAWQKGRAYAINFGPHDLQKLQENVVLGTDYPEI